MSSIKRSTLYSITGLLAAGAYALVGWMLVRTPGNVIELCHFKRLSELPCPSCGVTRSILLLLNGDLAGALQMNPVGLPALLIMVIVPLWVLFDVLTGKSSFYLLYQKLETAIKKSGWIFPFILVLIGMLWAWLIINNV